MTAETRRTCRDALYARLEALDNDLRSNQDFYAKGDWRTRLHRRRAAVEILAIRRALRELSFMDWAVAS